MTLPPDKPDDWLRGYIAGHAAGYKAALEWALADMKRIADDKARATGQEGAK